MKKRRVLVVDDEPSVAKTVKVILSAEGYTVSTALSGKECLKKLEKEEYDLIILDVMMPEMNGWQVFDEIKKKHKGQKVIYLTVIRYADTMIDQFITEGISGIINKPFDRQELIDKVEEVLGS